MICNLNFHSLVIPCLNFQVARADYLSGRTALHFAAVNGHVRCIRLLVADFIPSAPLDSTNTQNADGGEGSNTRAR